MENQQYDKLFGYGRNFSLKELAKFKNDLSEEQLISAIKQWDANKRNDEAEMNRKWPQKDIDSMGYY